MITAVPVGVACPPTADPRDRLLAQLLLVVHPAVPRESQCPALMVWAFQSDPLLAARAIRRSPVQVDWLLLRFARRVASLRLPERIPVGRNCSDRIVALLDLLESVVPGDPSPRRSTGALDVELLMACAGAAEFLVRHPLAGTLGAHRLRSFIATRRYQLRITLRLEDWLAVGTSPSARLLSAVLASPQPT